MVFENRSTILENALAGAKKKKKKREPEKPKPKPANIKEREKRIAEFTRRGLTEKTARRNVVLGLQQQNPDILARQALQDEEAAARAIQEQETSLREDIEPLTLEDLPSPQEEQELQGNLLQKTTQRIREKGIKGVAEEDLPSVVGGAVLVGGIAASVGFTIASSGAAAAGLTKAVFAGGAGGGAVGLTKLQTSTANQVLTSNIAAMELVAAEVESGAKTTAQAQSEIFQLEADIMKTERAIKWATHNKVISYLTGGKDTLVKYRNARNITIPSLKTKIINADIQAQLNRAAAQRGIVR